MSTAAPRQIRRPHWLCGHFSHFSRWPTLQIAQRASLATRLLLCVSLQFLLVGSCFADGPNAADTDPQTSGGGLATLSLQQLADVQVTSTSKEPEELRETPAAVYVLTADDIRRSGATTIPEVLRLVPGVEVARIDSDHWSVGIRGFGSSFSKSLLVLIDGRSVYTQLFAGVYWDVQDVPLEDIDRIEVIRGPGGTIWGPNAVNGVINIITKNAHDTQGVLVTAGGGGLDAGTATVRYGGSAGRGLDYRVYGTLFTRGAENHPENPHYDEWRQQQGGFRLDDHKSPHNEFTLQGDIYGGQDGEITSAGSFSPPSQIVLAGSDAISGGNLLAHWRHEFTGGSDLQVQAYYDRTDRRAAQYGEADDTFDVDLLYHLKAGERNNVLFGAGGRADISDFRQTIPTLNFLPNRETDTIYSAFAQDEIQIIEHKLSLTVGSKFEDNNFSGFDAQPSIRALWTPAAHSTIWGAVTRAVRDPSRLDTELHLLDFLGIAGPPLPPVPVYLGVNGDPSFEPEALLGYELGYRGLVTSKFFVDVSAFDNQYNDLVSYGKGSEAVKASPIVYLLLAEPFANGINGATRGFEVAPDWKPFPWWQLKGSYSYLHLHAENKPGITDSSTAATYNGSSPTHEVVAQSLLNLPKRFELDLTYRYVSALPAQDVQAYSTADARFGWHLTREVEFSVAGQNLLQPFHGEFGNTPGPVVEIRRTVYAKVTWTHDDR